MQRLRRRAHRGNPRHGVREVEVQITSEAVRLLLVVRRQSVRLVLAQRVSVRGRADVKPFHQTAIAGTRVAQRRRWRQRLLQHEPVSNVGVTIAPVLLLLLVRRELDGRRPVRACPRHCCLLLRFAVTPHFALDEWQQIGAPHLKRRVVKLGDLRVGHLSTSQ